MNVQEGLAIVDRAFAVYRDLELYYKRPVDKKLTRTLVDEVFGTLKYGHKIDGTRQTNKCALAKLHFSVKAIENFQKMSTEEFRSTHILEHVMTHSTMRTLINNGLTEEAFCRYKVALILKEEDRLLSRSSFTDEDRYEDANIQLVRF
jgi:hypothetical protein